MRVYACWLVCQEFWCLGACLLALWLVGWLAGCLACWFVVVVWLLVWSLVRLGSCLLIVSFRLGFEPDPAELKHTMAPRRRARESGQGRSMRKDLGRQGKHYRTPAGVRRQPFVFRSGCTLCSEASTNFLPRGSTQAQHVVTGRSHDHGQIIKVCPRPGPQSQRPGLPPPATAQQYLWTAAATPPRDGTRLICRPPPGPWRCVRMCGLCCARAVRA